MTPKSAAAPPRKRRRKDPGAKARARLFVWLLWKYSGKSWDCLDDRFLNREEREDGGRQRVFHRVFTRGTDPRRIKARQTGKAFDLVSLSAEEGFSAAAREAFNSAIWTLVLPELRNSAKEAEMVSELLKKMGLFQSDLRLGWTAYEHGLAGPDVFRLGDLVAIQRGAALIAARGSLDALAILAVFTRRAISELSLSEATIWLKAFTEAFDQYCLRHHLPDRLSAELSVMFVKRALQDDWSPSMVEAFFDGEVRMGFADEQGVDHRKSYEFGTRPSGVFAVQVGVSNTWPVVPDSKDLQWLMSYLEMKALPRLLRDATAALQGRLVEGGMFEKLAKDLKLRTGRREPKPKGTD